MEKDTHTRVEVLETRMVNVEKVLGVVVDKIDGVARSFAAQPRHTSIVDQFTVIGSTIVVMSGIFAGMTWWLNTTLAPDRQRLDSVYQQSSDIAVMRYRLEEVEKRVVLSKSSS